MTSLSQRSGEAIAFEVYGSPAPQGSKRFVGFAGGRGVMVESSKAVKPWRQDVVSAACGAHGGRPPLDGALRARIIFTVRKPVSAPKRRTTYPCSKPDLSKLLRSTEDALVTAGVISDDARIVEFTRLAKVYPNEDPEALGTTGARISIERIVAAEKAQ